jgi:protein involved in polysaccharide export with SLBB domain
LDQVNFDYAVVERVNRRDLSVTLLPFNLGEAIDHEKSPENLSLEEGDIVTVFSIDDVRVPIAKRRILIKLEGEVARPGIYQAAPSDTLKSILKRAGGLTQDAYLFGAGFYREDVRQSQLQNLEKLLRRLESESNASLSQLAQSSGASTNAAIIQAKVLAAQQTQRDAIARLKNLKPEGRISLGLDANDKTEVEQLPALHLQNNDRIWVPSKPDFVYVFGAINTESALIYKSGWTVQDYLNTSGMGSGADKDAVILMRADGSALTSNSSWRNQVLSTSVLPGDTIVVPDKLDRESLWSTIFRNTLDGTQIFYQLGLGAAAIKTLKN